MIGVTSLKAQQIAEPYRFVQTHKPSLVNIGTLVDRVACWVVNETQLELDYNRNSFIIEHLSCQRCTMVCRIYAKNNTGSGLEIHVENQNASTTDFHYSDNMYSCTIQLYTLTTNTQYNVYYSIKENENVVLKYIPMVKFKTKRRTFEIVEWQRAITNGTYSITIQTNDDVFDNQFEAVRFDQNNITVTDSKITKLSQYMFLIQCEVTDLCHNSLITPTVEFTESSSDPTRSTFRFDDVVQMCKTTITMSDFKYIAALNHITILFDNNMHTKHIFVNSYERFDLKSPDGREYVVDDLNENTVYTIEVYETDALGNQSQHIRKHLSTLERIIHNCVCITNHPTKLTNGHQIKNIYFRSNFEIQKMTIVLKSSHPYDYFRWENVHFSVDKKSAIYTYHVYDVLDLYEIDNDINTLELFVETPTIVKSLKRHFFYEKLPSQPCGELVMIPKSVHSEHVDVQIIRYDDTLNLALDYTYNIGCRVDILNPTNDIFHKKVTSSFQTVAITNLLPDTPYQLCYEVIHVRMPSKYMQESFRFTTKPHDDYVLFYMRKNGFFKYPLSVAYCGVNGKHTNKTISGKHQLPYYQEVAYVKRGSTIMISHTREVVHVPLKSHLNHYMLQFNEGETSTQFSYRFYGFSYDAKSSVWIQKNTVIQKQNIMYT